MRSYEKPTFAHGPRLQAVTAQVVGCVSPFFVDCFVEPVAEPPPPPPPG